MTHNNTSAAAAAGLFSAMAAAAGLNRNNAAYADGSSDDSLPPPPPRVRNDHPRTSSAGFDPEALERGVKALKKITNSPSTPAKKVSTFPFPCLQSSPITKWVLLNLTYFFLSLSWLKVFEVIKKQEETKQTEFAAKVAEFKQMQAQHETVTRSSSSFIWNLFFSAFFFFLLQSSLQNVYVVCYNILCIELLCRKDRGLYMMNKRN